MIFDVLNRGHIDYQGQLNEYFESSDICSSDYLNLDSTNVFKFIHCYFSISSWKCGQFLKRLLQHL